MRIERRFLGWQESPLHMAVDELWQMRRSEAAGSSLSSSKSSRSAPQDEWDLSHLLVVVAGARAGQRLMELLVARGAELGVRLLPPRMTTVGGLPEFLYRAQRPFASPWTQQLAWVKALQQLDAAALSQLIPAPEQIRRAGDWLEIAQLLSRLARELGDEGLSFADVLKHGKEAAESFPEAARWESLTELQRKYLGVLDQVELWDRQTARLVALERGATELQTDFRIVLLGTVDLGHATRKMLDQLTSPVVSLIFAPEELATRFDEHGCLVPAAWQDAEIPIRDDQVLLADTPLDQATALLQAMGTLLSDAEGAAAGLESLSVAIADARLVPVVERRCQAVQQSTRWLGGVALADTLPFRFLSAVSAYLERHWYVEFAALVRHPDVKDWLSRKLPGGEWLIALDIFQNERLPLEVSESFFGKVDAAQRQHRSRPSEPSDTVVEPISEQLFEEIASLLAPLRQAEAGWINVWGGIRQVLLTLYGDIVVDVDALEGRQVWGALRKINDVLDELLQLPVELQLELGPAEAIRYLLSAVQQESLGLPVNADELELMGWLDLPWDDAAHAYVVGFNEGIVPASESAELFLPDRLRSQLGLIDSSRRYARDAYAVNLAIHSKQSVHFIVGRRDAENNPLAPSRLLFAVPVAAIGGRALSLFRDAPERFWISEQTGTTSLHRPANGFRVPRPDDEAPVLTELSVTRFADYLACPYRFYLNSVLRLQSIDDQVDEIPSNVFGTLMHDLLEDFGNSSIKNTQAAKEIEDFLNDRLDRKIARRFTQLALPTVPIQLGQLRRRLAAFAESQSRRAAEGWEIWMTEVTQLRAELRIDGEPFWITGRIDRIDFHPGHGHYALLDYKSAEAPRSPEVTHREKGEWVNLQLPLYRHLAGEIEELDGPIRLGFFVLPKDISQVGILEAQWSEVELVEADACAERVIRALRERRFWPPRELSDRWHDPLGRICQVGIFDRLPDEADGTERESAEAQSLGEKGSSR